MPETRVTHCTGPGHGVPPKRDYASCAAELHTVQADGSSPLAIQQRVKRKYLLHSYDGAGDAQGSADYIAQLEAEGRKIFLFRYQGRPLFPLQFQARGAAYGHLCAADLHARNGYGEQGCS